MSELNTPDTLLKIYERILYSKFIHEYIEPLYSEFINEIIELKVMYYIGGGRSWYHNFKKQTDTLTLEELISILPGNIDMVIYIQKGSGLYDKIRTLTKNIEHNVLNLNSVTYENKDTRPACPIHSSCKSIYITIPEFTIPGDTFKYEPSDPLDSLYTSILTHINADLSTPVNLKGKDLLYVEIVEVETKEDWEQIISFLSGIALNEVIIPGTKGNILNMLGLSYTMIELFNVKRNKAIDVDKHRRNLMYNYVDLSKWYDSIIEFCKEYNKTTATMPYFNTKMALNCADMLHELITSRTDVFADKQKSLNEFRWEADIFFTLFQYYKTLPRNVNKQKNILTLINNKYKEADLGFIKDGVNALCQYAEFTDPDGIPENVVAACKKNPDEPLPDDMPGEEKHEKQDDIVMEKLTNLYIDIRDAPLKDFKLEDVLIHIENQICYNLKTTKIQDIITKFVHNQDDVLDSKGLIKYKGNHDSTFNVIRNICDELITIIYNGLYSLEILNKVTKILVKLGKNNAWLTDFLWPAGKDCNDPDIFLKNDPDITGGSTIKCDFNPKAPGHDVLYRLRKESTLIPEHILKQIYTHKGYNEEIADNFVTQYLRYSEYEIPTNHYTVDPENFRVPSSEAQNGFIHTDKYIHINKTYEKYIDYFNGVDVEFTQREREIILCKFFVFMLKGGTAIKFMLKIFRTTRNIYSKTIEDIINLNIGGDSDYDSTIAINPELGKPSNSAIWGHIFVLIDTYIKTIFEHITKYFENRCDHYSEGLFGHIDKTIQKFCYTLLSVINKENTKIIPNPRKYTYLNTWQGGSDRTDIISKDEYNTMVDTIYGKQQSAERKDSYKNILQQTFGEFTDKFPEIHLDGFDDRIYTCLDTIASIPPSPTPTPISEGEPHQFWTKHGGSPLHFKRLPMHFTGTKAKFILYRLLMSYKDTDYSSPKCIKYESELIDITLAWIEGDEPSNPETKFRQSPLKNLSGGDIYLTGYNTIMNELFYEFGNLESLEEPALNASLGIKPPKHEGDFIGNKNIAKYNYTPHKTVESYFKDNDDYADDYATEAKKLIHYYPIIPIEYIIHDLVTMIDEVKKYGFHNPKINKRIARYTMINSVLCAILRNDTEYYFQLPLDHKSIIIKSCDPVMENLLDHIFTKYNETFDIDVKQGIIDAIESKYNRTFSFKININFHIAICHYMNTLTSDEIVKLKYITQENIDYEIIIIEELFKSAFNEINSYTNNLYTVALSDIYDTLDKIKGEKLMYEIILIFILYIYTEIITEEENKIKKSTYSHLQRLHGTVLYMVMLDNLYALTYMLNKSFAENDSIVKFLLMIYKFIYTTAEMVYNITIKHYEPTPDIMVEHKHLEELRKGISKITHVIVLAHSKYNEESVNRIYHLIMQSDTMHSDTMATVTEIYHHIMQDGGGTKNIFLKRTNRKTSLINRHRKFKKSRKTSLIKKRKKLKTSRKKSLIKRRRKLKTSRKKSLIKRHKKFKKSRKTSLIKKRKK